MATRLFKKLGITKDSDGDCPNLEMIPKGLKVLFVVDGTGSMGVYLQSVKDTILQIARMFKMVESFPIGVLLYRDYCYSNVESSSFSVYSKKLDGVLNWSGYVGPEELDVFCQKLFTPYGGGDGPEAAKTAFNETLKLADGDTIVIHYTDAPPHGPSGGHGNPAKERKALEKSCGEIDWVKLACNVAEKLNVVSITTCNSYHNLLLGPTFRPAQTDATSLTKLTISVLMQMLGFEVNEEFLLEGNPVQLQEGFQINPDLTQANFQYVAKVQPMKNVLLPIVGPFSEGDLRKLATKFKADSKYQDIVYEIFEKMLCDTNGALSLTYNAVFGALWRAICTQRLYDSRAEALGNKMGQLVNSLTGDHRVKVQEWLENSYNSEDEINQIIAKYMPTGEDADTKPYPVFILDAREFLTKRELINIVRCTANGKESAQVQKLIAHIQAVDANNATIPEDVQFLPVCLTNNELFSCLTHLICRGLMVGSSATKMVAALCYVSRNKFLADRAKEYLTHVAGKWIQRDEDHPEFYTVEFVRLAMAIKDFGLSEEELAFYTYLSTFARVRLYGNKSFDLQRPYDPPGKLYVIPDDHVKCDCCGEMRSKTLMASETKCGPCVSPPSEPSIEPQSQMDDMSFMHECSTCASLYAVIRIDLLNVRPKCHFCRQRQPVPTVSCGKCNNKFVDGAGLLAKEKDFVCACCRNKGEPQTSMSKGSFEEICALKPELITLFGIKYHPTFFQRRSLFKSMSVIEKLDEPELIENVLDHVRNMMWNLKPVLNTEELVRTIYEDVHSNQAAEEICCLCCESKPHSAFVQACGHCDQRLCQACSASWYGEVSPGNIVFESHTVCPFCKHVPKFAVLQKVNHPLALIARRMPAFKPSAYHAWCANKSCGKVCEFGPRVCVGEAPKLDGTFLCAECSSAKAITLEDSMKQCPSCGIGIEKLYGCDHMHCLNCDEHFCWECMFFTKGGSADTIYDHMAQTHN